MFIVQPGEKTKISFGILLKKYRVAACLEPAELARAVSVSTNTIYRVERGEVWVGADVLERLCEILHVDPWRFFFDGEPAIEPEEALEILARWVKSKRGSQ